MSSLLREVPPAGWLLTTVICARTTVLALGAVAPGQVIDDQDPRSAVLAVTSWVLLAAALLAVEQFLPQGLSASTGGTLAAPTGRDEPRPESGLHRR